MSTEQLNLAFKSDVKPSARKFVLVALADYANAENQAYPSVETLARKTGQDRKTVINHLAALQADGFISDTGERKGPTRGVKVWCLSIPKTVHLKKVKERGSYPKNGTPNSDYNHTENGTPSKPSSTENGHRTVPKTVPLSYPKNGTQNHHSFNHQSNRQEEEGATPPECSHFSMFFDWQPTFDEMTLKAIRRTGVSDADIRKELNQYIAAKISDTQDQRTQHEWNRAFKTSLMKFGLNRNHNEQPARKSEKFDAASVITNSPGAKDTSFGY